MQLSQKKLMIFIIFSLKKIIFIIFVTLFRKYVQIVCYYLKVIEIYAYNFNKNKNNQEYLIFWHDFSLFYLYLLKNCCRNGILLVLLKKIRIFIIFVILLVNDIQWN